jgi:hypothetical protein
VYLRGNQPATVREIAPIAITDDEVGARDLAVGRDKSFKLAHLELAGSQTVVGWARDRRVSDPHFVL